MNGSMSLVLFLHLRALFVNFFLDIGSNLRGVFTKRLTSFISSFFLTNVFPKSRILIVLEKSSRRVEFTNFRDDATSNKPLFSFETSCEINTLALFNQLAKSFIPRVGINRPSSSAQNIVRTRIFDSFV